MTKYGFILMIIAWIVSTIVAIIDHDSSTLIVPAILTAGYGIACYHGF